MSFVWDFDPVLLDLGSIKIRYYGVLFGLTILLGYYLFRQMMRHYRYTDKLSESCLVYGFLGVLVGARLVHVVFYDLNFYLANPLKIVMVWEGGVASHGAALGLIIASVWLAIRKKIHLLHICDGVVFAAAVGATMVRVGNFFNSEAVGSISTSPWGVKLLRYPPDFVLAMKNAAGQCVNAQRECLIEFWPIRHTTQLYEALGGLIVLVILLVLHQRMRNKQVAGLYSGLFLVLYFSFRFLIEFIKDAPQLFYGLSPGQYLSIPFVIGGIVILAVSFSRSRAQPQKPC